MLSAGVRARLVGFSVLPFECEGQEKFRNLGPGSITLLLGHKNRIMQKEGPYGKDETGEYLSTG